MRHPNKIKEGTAHLDNFFPDIRSDLKTYGKACYLNGVSEGLKVGGSLCIWLQLDTYTKEQIREMLIDLINEIVDNADRKTMP